MISTRAGSVYFVPSQHTNTLKLHLFNYVVIELDVVSLVKTLFHLIWSLCEMFRALASQTDNCCSGPDQRMARQRSCINFTEIAFKYRYRRMLFLHSFPSVLHGYATGWPKNRYAYAQRSVPCSCPISWFWKSSCSFLPKTRGVCLLLALHSDLYFTGVKQE